MGCSRIIAGVILLAAVVVAVPFAPGVWEKVAYREDTFWGLAYFRPRWKWLPGTEKYAPDQVCTHCRSGEHDRCWRLDLEPARHVVYSPAFRQEFPDFRCTCTDPPQDGER